MPPKQSLTNLRRHEGRGKLLTILILISILMYIPSINLEWINIVRIIGLGLLYGIWKWNKLAAYLFLIYFLIAFIIRVITTPLKDLFFSEIGGKNIPIELLYKPDLLTAVVWSPVLIFSFIWVLWVWAIYRKRNLFN